MPKSSDIPLSERYAKQRLMRILTDMVEGNQLLSWSALASDISVHRGVEFSRENLRRLRHGTLGPANVEIIIQYMEAKHDPNIRNRLRPETIFDEMAQSARDYYFHMPAPNDMDDWNEQLLEEFSGVYFCCQKLSTETYLPARVLRERVEKQVMPSERFGRTVIQSGVPLLENLIAQRSILVLQPTKSGYFYAAELPLSSLVPRKFTNTCDRAIFEGIGVISANTIQVQLRDCLTRIPRTHSITVSEKGTITDDNPKGLKLAVLKNAAQIFEEWDNFTEDELASFRKEFALSIGSDYYLEGQATRPISPLPRAQVKVERILSQSLVYHQKPQNFLENLEDHFFFSHVTGVDEIRKIVENPLIIGILNEH